MKIAPIKLWVTDAATIFLNGFVAGIGTGSIIGGTAAATADVMDPQTLTTRAAIGLVLAAAANGIKRVVVWHDTNPIPNPFREPPQAT